ncbi:Protein Hook [Seminavis robusta]|uniref:Protein Hook n=1 Tax=Seminavis robusta TaxID=568900 RepID=A0A9N8HT07_9STRA|nr:Protein Hook [Seminavis robusta]|eukprot:Sro1221_g253720.1 Protein Hook (603) ;mRNA; f:26777-28669
MGDEDRYTAMVEFLGTFPTLSGSPPAEMSDLSDGVALFEALSEIAPDHFDPTTIARHLGDNWALKSSNLRKLLRNLENYFQEDLKKDAAESFSALNVSDIARHAEPGSISLLVELVAAAAVTCPDRAEYVGRIMQMTPNSQMQMKGIIESSMTRLSDYEPSEDGEMDDSENVGDDENELVFGQDEDEDVQEDGGMMLGDGGSKHLFVSGHNRSTPTASAVDIAEKEHLEKKLADARREMTQQKAQADLLTEEHEKAQKKLKALVEDLQDRLVKRQDELIDTEEELRTATSELSDLKSKLIELEEQKAQLADELDVASSRVEQLRKTEATVMAYRKKLESVGAMNQQMTDLEDQAANYLRQIMDLESEVKKSATLQKGIDELNKKVDALEKEKAESSDSVKNTMTEIADLKSKLSAAETAKKMYESELTELRAQQNNMPADDLGDGFGDAGMMDAESATQNKEKFMRLQIENKTLKEELEKLKAGGAVSTAAAVASGDAGALQQEIERLKEELVKKEKENAKIGSDKDKLETYTKRTLAKFQDKYLVALQECKAKLREKQDKIEALENRSASEKTAQKREERLLSSTIYELGLAIMQNRLKER